jgi:uncharacterized membrane protein
MIDHPTPFGYRKECADRPEHLVQMTLLPPLTVWIVQWWAGRSATRGAFMMNHTDGWMGGGMWIWTVIGVLVVVLLVVVINKLSKK